MLQKKRKQKIKEIKKSRKGKDEIASKLLQKKLMKAKKNREFKVQINLLFMATAAACLALTGLCHRNFGGNLSQLSSNYD